MRKLTAKQAKRYGAGSYGPLSSRAYLFLVIWGAIEGWKWVGR